MDVFLGLDIGGSKVAAVAVNSEGRSMFETWREHSRRSADGLLDALDEVWTDAMHQLGPGKTVSGVGVGLAAWMDRDREQVRLAANLPVTEQFAEVLSRQWNVPVRLENDGNASALGEFRFGAGRDHPDQTLVLISLGTGVGGGIVVRGQPLVGAHGLAAEVGHVAIDDSAGPCVCGGRGCLELFASAPAVARAGGKASAAEVVDAAEHGDPIAQKALSDAGTAVGKAIALIGTLLDPQHIVLAGSLAISAAESLLPAITAVQTRTSLTQVREHVSPVHVSNVGPFLGAYGAAALVLPSPSH